MTVSLTASERARRVAAALASQDGTRLTRHPWPIAGAPAPAIERETQPAEAEPARASARTDAAWLERIQLETIELLTGCALAARRAAIHKAFYETVPPYQWVPTRTGIRRWKPVYETIEIRDDRDRGELLLVVDGKKYPLPDDMAEHLARVLLGEPERGEPEQGRSEQGSEPR